MQQKHVPSFAESSQSLSLGVIVVWLDAKEFADRRKFKSINFAILPNSFRQRSQAEQKNWRRKNSQAPFHASTRLPFASSEFRLKPATICDLMSFSLSLRLPLSYQSLRFLDL
jgi:hypothetical protein